MLQRLVAGSASQKTRIHDELSNRVSLSRLIRNGPPAIVTGLLRLIFGYRVTRPWISYDAQSEIRAFLSPTSRVLEYGSGMSTLWLAKYAQIVCSVEDHEIWYANVQRILAAESIYNVEYRFSSNERDYTAAFPEFEEQGFDFILVDGSHRESCVRHAINIIRAGGIIYLDNSDKGAGETTGNIPNARTSLLEFAAARGATVKKFTDFAPTQFFVEQGILVKLPS